ncbi:enhanced serine sensitivity protein SseB C-terminal domain-containing protein [Paraburkholderia denitrificans]|uniref:Enhanced serine sensitivity protein SseB C-terminal domain-containing protein n=1 Tax=Paraburkholderia denitrificans TaxID=694025 RepID=A0ABW0JDQ4_9BURK
MYVERENDVERLLRLAATEPAYRPEFARTLLQAEVFILGYPEGELVQGTLRTGANVAVKSWCRPDGSPVIPFFTSEKAMRLAIREEEKYLRLPARSLFEITRGAALVLNPQLDYGKEFIPAEVEALLSTGVSNPGTTRIVRQETKVLIGKPRVWPEDMAQSVTKLLAGRREVKAAYLALMHDASIDEQPHLLFAIELEGEDLQVLRDVGAVADEYVKSYGPTDVMRIAPGDSGLAGHFYQNDKPFYERTLATKLKRVFGFGRR